MADVTITVDGKKITAPAGSLLIDVCRKAGIEIPAFCYYPGLSAQAACRMCLVRQEKAPKLQTACTTAIAEGQIFYTTTPDVVQARRAVLELLLANHPLDCPVCDAGGECELQDMTFRYGAGESRFVEIKNHRDEQPWSPAVFYDRPRCILCYRCIRVCGEGMDVWALGLQKRGVQATIAPNGGDHLNCEQCGMCIDLCPVGALTSGSYRYKTRPWEMNHVATACAHCGDGCRVTLGVRQTADGAAILRADNRDKSGLNGDFLCAKGRFGFDFVESHERLTQPLIRNADGRLEPASWEQALRHAAGKLREIRDAQGGEAIGVLGSNRTTNEESYLLQKLARTVLGSNNIDHERTADYPAFVSALAGRPGRAASMQDLTEAPAILLIGGDPSEEHPFLAWQLRTNVRLNKARLYLANTRKIKLARQAKAALLLPEDGYGHLAQELAEGTTDFARAVAAEPELLVLLGNELSGATIQSLIATGLPREGLRFALLSDYVNARGAADMGLLPDRLPGYTPLSAPGGFAESYGPLPAAPGLAADEMLTPGKVAALLLVGANPARRSAAHAEAIRQAFTVVSDLYLTETASLAEVVLPAASLYEKSGTVTSSFGDVQRVQKAADRPGVKPDLEILARLAEAMGAELRALIPFSPRGVTADLGQSRGPQSGEADRHSVWLAAQGLAWKTSPFDPMALFDEIVRLTPGYGLSPRTLLTQGAAAVEPGASVAAPSASSSVQPRGNGRFTSGTLGGYSANLRRLEEDRARKDGQA